MKETQINNSPKFTVIIPSHNRAHLISKGIKSVINQTFQDWELLFIDDGSTDHTKEVVKSFQDQRIQYIYQERAERSTARNKGIEAATGTYICFLDDDDYYLENHLDLFYQEIVKQNFPVKIFRNGFYYLNKGKLKKSKNYSENHKMNPVMFWALNFCGVWSLAIHKECLIKNKFPITYKYWEDTHLILRILCEYPFHQLQSYSYVYVISPNMGSRIALMGRDVREVCNSNIDAIKNLFISEKKLSKHLETDSTLKFLLSKKYLDYAQASLSINNGVDSKYFISKSLKYGFHIKLIKKYFICLIHYILNYKPSIYKK